MPTAELGEVTIHYQRRGEGPPLLGIMGFALDQKFWAGQIPAVTETHEFITFDNRGVGRSTGPYCSTIADMADDAAMLLDHLGIESAAVMGVSMGGAIAQTLALTHPEKVSALILGITWARPLEFMRRQHEFARLILEHFGVDAMTDATLVRMFTPSFFEAGRETIDRLVEIFRAESAANPVDPKVLLAQIDAIEKHDVLAELGAIDVPTLVFGGRMDMMVPGFASKEIADAIPGAELAMFETGHGLTIEEMDAVNARISGFLATLV